MLAVRRVSAPVLTDDILRRQTRAFREALEDRCKDAGLTYSGETLDAAEDIYGESVEGLLRPIAAAVPTQLEAHYGDLLDFLNRIGEYLDKDLDVVDGANGEPKPNGPYSGGHASALKKLSQGHRDALIALGDCTSSLAAVLDRLPAELAAEIRPTLDAAQVVLGWERAR